MGRERARNRCDGKEERVIPPLVWLWPVDGFGRFGFVGFGCGGGDAGSVQYLVAQASSSSLPRSAAAAPASFLLVSCVESFSLFFLQYIVRFPRHPAMGSRNSRSQASLDISTDAPPPQTHQIQASISISRANHHSQTSGQPQERWKYSGRGVTLLNIWNRSLGVFLLTSRLFPRGFADTLPTARREPR